MRPLVPACHQHTSYSYSMRVRQQNWNAHKVRGPSYTQGGRREVHSTEQVGRLHTFLAAQQRSMAAARGCKHSASPGAGGGTAPAGARMFACVFEPQSQRPKVAISCSGVSFSPLSP